VHWELKMAQYKYNSLFLCAYSTLKLHFSYLAVNDLEWPPVFQDFL